MDSKNKPVIYNYGPVARDACWTELRKSLDQFSNLQHDERSPTNLDDEATTVKEKDFMVTPQSPLQPPVIFPPPVIRRFVLEHERRKVFTTQTSPTADKNKDSSLELWSTTPDAEKTQSCVDNVITVKPSSGQDKKDDSQCTLSNDCSVQEPCDSFDSTDVKNDSQNNDPSTSLYLDGKNDNSAGTNFKTPSNLVIRSLVLEHCSRRKLFIDSPPQTTVDCVSSLPAKSDAILDAEKNKKIDTDEDLKLGGPLQSLPSTPLPDHNHNTPEYDERYLAVNKFLMSKDNNMMRFIEIDNILESYCKLFLGMFLFAVLLRLMLC